MKQLTTGYGFYETSTNNYNGGSNRKADLTLSEVDNLAQELCKDYNNPGFHKWYCKVIHTLGAKEVRNLRNRASDAKYPARLFSKMARERMAEITKEEIV